jgi:hypothetical protein
MPLPSPDFSRTPLELSRIQQYVWTRYVEHGVPEQPLDESEALARLESHHGIHGMDADAECFYYGILAFERSFAEPDRGKELLERALTAFRAYRRQTSEGFVWETIEDRYQETLERLGLVTGTAH